MIHANKIITGGLIAALATYSISFAFNESPEEKILRGMMKANEGIKESNEEVRRQYLENYESCIGKIRAESENMDEELRDCQKTREADKPLLTTGSLSITGTGNLAPTKSEPPLGKLNVSPVKPKQISDMTGSKPLTSFHVVPAERKMTIASYYMKTPPNDVCKGWENNPKQVILHYTATDSDSTAHTIANGHKARFGVEYFIAYHYLIKEDGEIVNTRPENCGSIAVKDETLNRSAIHISYTGEGKPNEKQIESMVSLTRDIQNRYKMSRNDVTAHADIQAKNKQESMEGMFGSKEAFVKLLRLQDKITIYGKESKELIYLWQAWGDLDLIGTWFQESRLSNTTIGDGGDAIGYCQINKAHNPGWQKEYLALDTMEQRLNYCHDLYVYAQGKPKGVGGTFHGWYKRERHISNILIQ